MLLFGRHGRRVAFRRDPGLRAGAELFPCEAAWVAGVVEARRLQFSCGRACARAALASLGWPAEAIPVGGAGAPVWPAGIVGSISHCRDEAVAAVARSADLRAVGIDVETAEPFAPDDIERFCTDTDRSFRDGARLPPSLPWANLVFSAKEALLKAHYPEHGTRLASDAVAVRLTADPTGTSGAFRAVPLARDADDRAFCADAEGHWTVRNGHVYCAAICAPFPSSRTGKDAKPRWTS